MANAGMNEGILTLENVFTEGNAILNFKYNVNNISNGSNMDNIYVSKVTSAGQISIPKKLRETLGLKEGYVVLERCGDAIILKKVKSYEEELFAYFEKGAKRRRITKEMLRKAVEEAKRETFREMYQHE